MMTLTKRQFLSGLLVTSAITACDIPTTGVSGNPVGVGVISARTSGSGYTTSPTVTFYRVTGAAFVTTEGLRDTCFTTAFSGSNEPGTPSASPVGAGAFVTMRVGARTDSLARSSTATDPTYRTATAAGFPFTPGDSVVISIPGDPNGFPTSEFRGRTAEPFVLTPITVPATGDSIVVTWSPAGGTGAGMLLSFSYATGTATTPNQQIACTFVDDGTAIVDPDLAALWAGSANRDLTARRIRTILAEVSVPRSYFNVVSSFSWPTPTSP